VLAVLLACALLSWHLSNLDYYYYYYYYCEVKSCEHYEGTWGQQVQLCLFLFLALKDRVVSLTAGPLYPRRKIIIIIIYCRRNPVQKKPGETSRHVRPERVSRCPNCMLIDDDDDDNDYVIPWLLNIASFVSLCHCAKLCIRRFVIACHFSVYNSVTLTAVTIAGTETDLQPNCAK
jgi:hypothetical protein